MVLNNLDILSSQITLYNKGLLYHSSLISVILSIISFIIICFFVILNLYKFSQRHKEPHKMSSYRCYIEDAGIFPINSSSFFHFISLNKNRSEPDNQSFDFETFRIIGLELYLDEYINNNNIYNFDHWLYGPCNNDTDTKGISTLITQSYFLNSACIRKYYNANENKYYNTTDSKFEWPTMSHGNFNNDKNFYTVFIEKCEQGTLDEIFGGDKKCNNLNISNELNNWIIHFNFIDHYIDIKNYNYPIVKYFYIIENQFNNEFYYINHLNYNPVSLTTNDGIIFDNTKENTSYIYDRNEIYMYKNNNKIYMGYYLWLNNRIYYYNREYIILTDVISDIGGISSVILSVFLFINKIFNDYSILKDTEELLHSSSIPLERIKKQINESKIKNRYIYNKSSSFTKGQKPIEQTAKSNISDSIHQLPNQNKTQTKSENINNMAYIKENDYQNSDTAINKDNNNVNIQENKNEKILFSYFILNKISFGKKYKYLKIYEDFRKKIISVENLIKNYLIINNLLKINDIKENT